MQESKLLSGSITKSLLIFALPMIAGNLLQQCYNIGQMPWQLWDLPTH